MEWTLQLLRIKDEFDSASSKENQNSYFCLYERQKEENERPPSSEKKFSYFSPGERQLFRFSIQPPLDKTMQQLLSLEEEPWNIH